MTNIGFNSILVSEGLSMGYIIKSIEENGVLYPIEIKQNPVVSAEASAAFLVLD
jgi:hypothetical protein